MIGSAHGHPGAQFATNVLPEATAPHETASRRPPAHARLYDRGIALQSEAQWPADLDVLLRSPEWLAATTVLDLGAGNGAFGRLLAARFPMKSIVALEPDEDLYAMGAQTPGPPNYMYLHGGFDPGLEGWFDVLLARSVLMYMPQHERVSLTRWASEHCWAALIQNNAQAASVVRPQTQLSSEVFTRTDWSHAADGAAIRRDRELVDTPELFGAAGFTFAGSTTAIATLSGARGRALAHHFLRAFAEIIDAAAVTKDMLDELFEWSLREDAYMTIGGTWYRFCNTRGSWPSLVAG
ncbi:MAG TPA: class I SAM-dependent methyltransferase [Solirubrobacteraceae bacterium]